MTTATLERSLMDYSLVELIEQAIALGGEKVHDMAKAIGHVRHKKTWIELIDQLSAIEVEAELLPEESPAEECQPVSRREGMIEEIERVRQIFDGDVKDIPFGDIYEIELAIELPPPPPPKPPIVYPIPERQDIPSIPGIEIAEEPPCNTPGSDRRECTCKCLTCDGTGNLDTNLICISCSGKGYRNTEDQLLFYLKQKFRKYMLRFHDVIWVWRDHLDIESWRSLMQDISKVRWQVASGRNIFPMVQAIRELYDKCNDKRPSYLSRATHPLPAIPFNSINEQSCLLLLIYPEHILFCPSEEFLLFYYPPKIYDERLVLGNSHLFIMPDETQAENLLHSTSHATEYVLVRGIQND